MDGQCFAPIGLHETDAAYDWLLLKVPKCEIFHLFDFNDFYGVKSL